MYLTLLREMLTFGMGLIRCKLWVELIVKLLVKGITSVNRLGISPDIIISLMPL